MLLTYSLLGVFGQGAVLANNIQIKRGTRSGLNALVTGNNVLVGQPYLITDEQRFAVGLSSNTYSAFVKEGETFTATKAGLVPASVSSNTTDFLRRDGTWAAPPTGGVTDGDKGDILVSGGAWTIDVGAVTLPKTTLGYVNVLDHGADSTGTVNSDAAFAAALATGKSVFVPKGTYRITAPIELKTSYQVLFGDYSLPLIRQYTANTPTFRITTNTGATLNEFPGIENFRIWSATPASFGVASATTAAVVIDGSPATASNAVQRARIKRLRILDYGTGFYLKQHTNTLIEDVFMEQSSLVSGSFTSSNVMVGVHCDGTPDILGGISPQASLKLHDVHIIGSNIPANVVRTGFAYDGADLRDIFMRDCEVADVNFALRVNATNDSYAVDIQIENFICDAFENNALLIENLKGGGQLSVRGGYSASKASSGNPHMWLGNCSGVTVSGWQFVGTNNNSDDAIRLFNSRNCSIIGNSFTNFTWGVSVQGSHFNTVSDNIFTADVHPTEAAPNQSDAVRLFGTSTNNTVANNNFSGASATYKLTNAIWVEALSIDNQLIGNVFDSATIVNNHNLSEPNNLIVAKGAQGNFTTTRQGLVPATGTSNTTDFLRRDGTWAAPATGGGGVTDGLKGDITVSNSGATYLVNAFDAAAFPVVIGATTAGNRMGQLLIAGLTTHLSNFSTSAKGVVPASGGGTINFLRADGTWAAPPSGGAADPLPLTTEVTADSPSGGSPATGVRLFTAVRANRRQPAWIAPTGRTERMQAFLGANDSRIVDVMGPNTTGGTAPTTSVGYHTTGCQMQTDLGTITHPALATTSWMTMQTRRVLSVPATANSIAESKSSHTWCSRRSVGGGFHWAMRFCNETAIQATGRVFAGLANITTAIPNADPLGGLANSIGIYKNSAGSVYALMLSAAAGSNQSVALTNTGAGSLAQGLVWHLEIFTSKGDAGFGWRVFRYNTDGSFAVDEGYTTTGNMPGIDTIFCPHLWHVNVAAAAQSVGFMQMYCESD